MQEEIKQETTDLALHAAVKNRAERRELEEKMKALDTDFERIVRTAIKQGGRGTPQRLAEATGLTKARISQVNSGKR